jgi:hypothetical protein
MLPVQGGTQLSRIKIFEGHYRGLHKTELLLNRVNDRHSDRLVDGPAENG